MFRVGRNSLRCGVVGPEPVVASLSECGSVAEASVDVTGVSPEVLAEGARGEHEVDCLVVDSTEPAADAGAVLDSVGDGSGVVPVVVLAGAWDDEQVTDVYRTGATAVLPRSLVDSDPELLIERLFDIAGCDRAWESFQELYDGIESLATLHDPETGELRDANRALCDLLGYDREELLSTGIGEFTADVPGYDGERVTRVVASATGGGEPIEFEWPVSTADGEVRWVESRLRPTRIGGRDVVLNTSLDVTERRRRERKYRQVFDNVNDAITVHDPWTEQLVDVNETLAEVTGYSRDALLEMGVDGFSANEEGFTAERAYEIQRQVAATGESETVDWVVETANGVRRRFECVLSPATIAGEDRVLVLGRDVTERRRLEETYRDLFENVSDGLVIHDPDSGEIVDVNGRFCEMNGYEREELVGETVDLITAPDHSFGSAQDRIDAAREEGPQLFEWQNRRKGGDTFPVEVHLSVVEFRGEERVLGSVRDITERKRREQAYEQIFNGVHDPITVHDPETAELLEVNDAFCEILGYDREEILEMGVEGYTPDDRDYTMADAREFVHEVVETGDPKQTEWAVETSEGETRWLEVKGTTVEIGGELRYVSIDRDITERRRREREYQQIFDGVHDAIVVHDPETGEMVDVNDSFCELMGYDRERILELGTAGVSVEEAGYTEQRAAEIIDRVMEEGEVGPFEWQVETRDGEHRILEVRATQAEIGGETRHVSLNRDVTERRRREREYEQIFDGVNDPITINDPETGEMVEVNDAMCDLLGYDREEILDLNVGGISVTEDGYTMDRAREAVRDVIESGSPETMTWKLETADGEHRWLEVNGTPAEIGGEERYLSITRDITERRRREREYEQIFNGVTDAITVFHPETGEILNVNETYHEMLGYDDLDRIRELGIEGLSVAEEGYTGEQGRALIRDVAETGEPQTVEWRGETKDGDRLWLEATLAAVEIGGERRVLSMQRDVTERKRREREYEQIFDGVTDAITIHDPETGDIVDCNERMCELTGYDGEELLEAGMESINVPEEGYGSERARRIIGEIMETGEARTLEWLIEREDGDRRWIEINATPAEIGGEQRYLSIMRDVTDKRRTERRLREILERIDEAIYLTRAAELTTPALSDDDLYAGYESIWGESLDEIFERHDSGFFDTLHPDEEGGFREFVDGIGADLDDGTVADRYTREYRIVRADGEHRWIRSDFYPIEWPTGSLRVVIVSRDVTERKSRERRIASFDDATDDLATADTREEATRTAVEAAAETLNLPAVGAFLYDGDDGVLQPEVLAGPLPDEVATDPIGPGDGPLWEGFATGTVVASDGGHGDTGFVGEDTDGPPELNDLEEWRALALGQHGVLLVGAPDAALDAEAIQATHVLAATLEAALNHLEGQQRLAAQEEQLRTQTQRAERLDRIARLTQQVEAAITDATDPGEIERAVCERLTSSGPYDLAWVGGIEAGSDRLTPHAVVGAPTQYVDGMDLATSDDTADPHPAVAAWLSDEAQVADSIVGDGPTGAWRRRVLSEGFQSLCAVPLTYDGITHGVLTVATDSPNAFGERERDVLAQLGTSIANALAAIERRRALESDETIELEFRGPGSALSVSRAADAADCRVTLERTVARQDGTVSVYVSFDDGEGALAVARETLPGSVDPVADDTDSTLVEARTDDWFGSPLAEYGGVLREATADPDGTVVTVEVPQQADVRSFVERLQDVAPSLELVARRQHSQRDRTPAELGDRLESELTDRQFEVLQTALTAGYFEWPRENDGSDVADRLDITQPTLNKHLRLAEQKTFSLLFGPEN